MALKGITDQGFNRLAKSVKGQEFEDIGEGSEYEGIGYTKPEIYEILREIYGHLGAAETQSIPSDDQIIMGHVRDALAMVNDLMVSFR